MQLDLASPDGLPLERHEAAPAEDLDALLLELEGVSHLRQGRWRRVFHQGTPL